MNGIDLLFFIAGLVLLFIVWHGSARFLEWSEWNEYRRRQRKLDRAKFEDEVSEIRYRQHIRFIFGLKVVAASITKVNVEMSKLNDNFKELGRVYRKHIHG